jgi:3-methyl-2-oxobutanoate hydroxymethyltransferase
MSVSPTNGPAGSDEPRIDTPVTVRTIEQMAQRGEPFACLACYDATTARWLQRAGVHVLLAGDSAAQVVLGHERSIDMPLEFAIEITAAIKRGAPRTLIMADMPFMTAHRSIDEAMSTAAAFMTRGGADVVKIEVDGSMSPLVDRLSRAGVPVCAHLGCLPQTSALTGGPKAAGRTMSELERLVDEARRMQDAGAVFLLLEAVPPDVTRAVLDATRIPVIGIGAGPECHGQILVVNDLVGLTDNPPRFAEPVAAMGETLVDAGREWVRRVRDRSIGGRSYTMRQGERDAAADSSASGAYGSGKSPNTPG